MILYSFDAGGNDDLLMIALQTGAGQSGVTVKRSTYTRAFVSARRPVTDDEKTRTKTAALAFQSVHPFFVVVMKATFVSRGFYMVMLFFFLLLVETSELENILLFNTHPFAAHSVEICEGTPSSAGCKIHAADWRWERMASELPL